MAIQGLLRRVLPLLAAAALQACGSGKPIDPYPEPCPPACPPVDTLEGRWAAAAPMPVYRREMPVALLDGRVYVPGGISETRGVLASVDVYDPATDRWSSGPAMPAPRHHHGAVGMDGKLYVIGGYSSLEPYWGPWPATSTVFELDPARGTWRERAPLPVQLAAMAVAALNGKIYVFGGSSGAAEYFFTYVYDPAVDRWTTAASMPTAREHTVAVAIGSTIYVVGGRTAAGRNVGALEAYSPASDSWRSLSPGVSTSGHAAAVMGGRLYVFGGESLGGGTFATVREYDPQADRWRQVVPLPGPRHGFGAVGLGSVIHVIGGSDEAGTQNLTFRLP